MIETGPSTLQQPYDFVTATPGGMAYFGPGGRCGSRERGKGWRLSRRNRKWRLNENSQKTYFERKEIR